MKAPEQIRKVERAKAAVATARHHLLIAAKEVDELDFPSCRLHLMIAIDNADDIAEKLNQRLTGKQMEQQDANQAVDLDAHRKRQRSGGGRW